MRIAKMAVVGIIAVIGILTLIGADCSQALPLDANFSANPTYGDAPLEVQFADRTAYDPETWYWEFGDGGHSPEQNPTHIYEAPGTYAVSLTVDEGEDTGDTETKTEYIIVS